MILEKSIEGSLLLQAHDLIVDVLEHGDAAVDATLGNGHDTLFLARCVGRAGKVFGFDVQQAAVGNAGKRLDDAGVDSCCYALFCESHADMALHITTKVKAVMFNLGYLPGGDKKIITQAHSTVAALSAAIESLSCGGILTVMCYPGHDGGADEADLVTNFVDELDEDDWRVTRYSRAEARASTPYLWTILDVSQKKRSTPE
jgi:hypothetical protein